MQGGRVWVGGADDDSGVASEGGDGDDGDGGDGDDGDGGDDDDDGNNFKGG